MGNVNQLQQQKTHDPTMRFHFPQLFSLPPRVVDIAYGTAIEVMSF